MSDEEKLKEKMMQNQEAMQLCSQETKKLEEMMLGNQMLIQRTNEDMKKVQQLQVSGSSPNNVIFIEHYRKLMLCTQKVERGSDRRFWDPSLSLQRLFPTIRR